MDILVNNAGIDVIEPFVDSTEDTWRRIVEVNYLIGTVIVSRAVLDSMTERGWGRIINISSDAGRVGSSGEVVYSNFHLDGGRPAVPRIGITAARARLLPDREYWRAAFIASDPSQVAPRSLRGLSRWERGQSSRNADNSSAASKGARRSTTR
nr:SDR family NAD(P)-dependent oxidoreductase [Sporichthya sp.]